MRTLKNRLMFVPVLMTSLAMLACAVPGTAPTATVVPTVAAPPTDVPVTEEPTAEVVPTEVVSGDARDELLRAIEAAKTSGPYRIVSSLVSGSTNVQEHGEVIPPDRYHLVATINTLPEREYIIIGPTTYLKAGDQWTSNTSDTAALVQGFINSFEPDQISDVSLLGIEDLNGVQAKHFQFTYTNTVSGVLITNTINMWVGVDNGLPLKQVIDGLSNGNPYHAEQTIEYDPSITIEAPAP